MFFLYLIFQKLFSYFYGSNNDKSYEEYEIENEVDMDDQEDVYDL